MTPITVNIKHSDDFYALSALQDMLVQLRKHREQLFTSLVDEMYATNASGRATMLEKTLGLGDPLDIAIAAAVMHMCGDTYVSLTARSAAELPVPVPPPAPLPHPGPAKVSSEPVYKEAIPASPVAPIGEELPKKVTRLQFPNDGRQFPDITFHEKFDGDLTVNVNSQSLDSHHYSDFHRKVSDHSKFHLFEFANIVKITPEAPVLDPGFKGCDFFVCDSQNFVFTRLDDYDLLTFVRDCVEKAPGDCAVSFGELKFWVKFPNKSDRMSHEIH